MMLNSATAEPVTHVLLFDAGTPEQVRALGENARVVSGCYRHILCEDSDNIMRLKYHVVFAVPEANSLVACSQDVAAELNAAGIYAYVAEVKSEDMFLYQGKVGLLSCVLWSIAGAVLLNEVPLSETQAEKLLHQANRFHHTAHHLILLKQRWFQPELRFGLVRSCTSIGYLLRDALIRGFPKRHSVSDILKAMNACCSGDDLFLA